MGRQTQDEMLLCSNELYVVQSAIRPWEGTKCNSIN
jgi:hypothetical protein